MATKKCPSCGKKIAVNAAFCIYCSHVFEDKPAPPVSGGTTTFAVPRTAAAKPDIDATQVLPDASKAGDEQDIGRLPETEEEPDNDPVDIYTHKTQPVNPHRASSPPKKRKRWLLLAAATVVVLAIILAVLLFSDAFAPPAATTPTEPAVTVTHTTVNLSRVSWLHTFTGDWVDDQSAGKGNLPVQGGCKLTVYSTSEEAIVFDLMSYSGGDTPVTASITNVTGTMSAENIVTFIFADDGLGHSGEGHMLLRDDGIDIEVTVKGDLAEGTPSLAMSAAFVRVNLPHSDGYDIRQFTTWQEAQAVVGDQTADPVTDEVTGTTVYTCGIVKLTAAADGTITDVTVDYAQSDEKSKYCYDCVDGTMTYDTVKAYYGEAKHDYVEQPTDIRVLYYLLDANATVTFTFDADNNLLMHIQYTR